MNNRENNPKPEETTSDENDGEDSVRHRDLAGVEEVIDDIAPALIRIEVTVTQLERRISYLTERVKQLDEDMAVQRSESAQLRQMIKTLQEA